MKRQSGFTLIELMIVVAIVAILAAIALPAYQSYTKKAKFSEVISATGAAKTAFEVCAQTTGTGCDTAAAAAISGYPRGFVQSVGVSGSVITATGTSEASGTYTLTGTVQSNKQVTWVKACTPADLC
ncbi:prepilin-type N-terminal cleavage/methylation domain-containing protein [Aeromonas caviae]|uniref:pilin n=1 Tax=Aeromonas caviae TaxID=648 RepID=UPI00191DA8F6|nr:prepilin-type N-terminal cleavage/methylation domain-containing protein [Aeromonas caviae]MBL0550614.1 prepilin-type N-terminal cleavage/methylation domain-containing protein [Aeromonas caviae]MDX7679233.1 prepilin-type N-terminal cleavage/methylation domain-containing protein [Aeromonas caviae]MDX7810289.1 prepilin-type N-terminal cleavage/methylation domain-containing protein [Aeromonas caviae]